MGKFITIITLTLFVWIMYDSSVHNYGYKEIEVYYVDGSKEVISIKHVIYSDRNFKKAYLDNGCLVYSAYDTIRCGVKKFKYIN